MLTQHLPAPPNIEFEVGAEDCPKILFELLAFVFVVPPKMELVLGAGCDVLPNMDEEGAGVFVLPK